MNHVIRSLAIGSLLIIGCVYSQPAEAGMVCTKDYLGRTTCQTSSGDTYTGTRDYLGRDNWTGPNGKSQTCSTDYLGRYICY